MNKAFPKIVGVVNVTPDSFSDGGRYGSRGKAVEHALALLKDGTDIVEIGGESTRPGAESVSAAVETERVVPVIEGIKERMPEARVSIDTSKLAVAEKAVEAGADIINDVTALGADPGIADLAASKGIPLVLMHMKGAPRNMQDNPVYADVISEVYGYLQERIAFARAKGVEKVIADVGIGFGKTLAHNLALLNGLNAFSGLEAELMLGISRKSFIKQLTGIEDPDERDMPTALIHALLLKHGTHYLRVHNVANIVMLKKLTAVIG